MFIYFVIHHVIHWMERVSAMKRETFLHCTVYKSGVSLHSRTQVYLDINQQLKTGASISCWALTRRRVLLSQTAPGIDTTGLLTATGHYTRAHACMLLCSLRARLHGDAHVQKPTRYREHDSPCAAAALGVTTEWQRPRRIGWRANSKGQRSHAHSGGGAGWWGAHWLYPTAYSAVTIRQPGRAGRDSQVW